MRAILQDFLDELEIQTKKLSNFNLETEQKLNRIGVYEFFFHLETYQDNLPE